MPTTEVTDEQKLIILKAIERSRPMVSKPSTTICMLALVIALCALSSAYPSRELGELASLAPTINQSSRRLFLSRAVIYLVRELVLDDGFARMDILDITQWLELFTTELKRSDNALRLGHDLNIGHGADYHNPQHNDIMYEYGCPWRSINVTNPAASAQTGGGGHRREADWETEDDGDLRQEDGEHVPVWMRTGDEADALFDELKSKATAGRLAPTPSKGRGSSSWMRPFDSVRGLLQLMRGERDKGVRDRIHQVGAAPRTRGVACDVRNDAAWAAECVTRELRRGCSRRMYGS